MSTRTKIIIGSFFIMLTIVYFRNVITSPIDTLLTKHLASDIYGHFIHVWERTNELRNGFLPIGSYWVSRGGGYPAAFNDQLLIPQELALMIWYVLTGSLTLAYKIVVVTSYFLTLILAFIYARYLFKRSDVGVVLAVAYTFSLYGANQLEHLELIAVQPQVLLVLLCLEKTLHTYKPIYVITTALMLFTLFLSNFYPLYFTLMYILLRVVAHLIETKQLKHTLISMTWVGVLFLLLCIPYVLPQLRDMPDITLINILKDDLSGYASPPSLLFIRNIPYEPYMTEIYFMYVGIGVLLLALIPTVTGSTNALYITNILITLFFILYSVGKYSPINIAAFIQMYIPFAFFIRVPGRAMLLGGLTLAVCAAEGLTKLIKKEHLIISLIISVLIFADLTIGFEPYTMPKYFNDNDAYAFIRNQPGDYRLIEIPSVHDQQALTTMYTGHDTLNSILWSFGLFKPLGTFVHLYRDYISGAATAADGALYGVKYIIIDTNPIYFNHLGSAVRAIDGATYDQTIAVDIRISEDTDYKLVFSSGTRRVYENLKYIGIVQPLLPAKVEYKRTDPNTLVIDVEANQPTDIIISQSYSKAWTARTDGVKQKPREYASLQVINVPAGTTSTVLHFDNYETYLYLIIASILAFILLAGYLILKGLNIPFHIYHHTPLRHFAIMRHKIFGYELGGIISCCTIHFLSSACVGLLVYLLTLTILQEINFTQMNTWLTNLLVYCVALSSAGLFHVLEDYYFGQF